MKLYDTNVLIYAVDPTAVHHARARRALDEEISSGRTVLLPWLALIGFIRLTTGGSLAIDPMSINEAVGVVKAWTSQPNVISPHPDSELIGRMEELLEKIGTGGNLVNDAYLAALALQHGATVVSFDNDFSRFPGVRWEQPD